MPVPAGTAQLQASSVAIYLTTTCHRRGKQGLQAAQTLLQQPQFEQLDLFSFKAIQRNKRLDIRLDKVYRAGDPPACRQN